MPARVKLASGVTVSSTASTGHAAIGTVGGNFYQNLKELDAYEAALEAGRLPIEKGLQPTDEDRLRRAVIMQLICHFALRSADIARKFGIDFRQHFAAELARLEPMQDDGLLECDADGIRVTDKGRLLIRNICMVFDGHLSPAVQQQRFSRAI